MTRLPVKELSIAHNLIKSVYLFFLLSALLTFFLYTVGNYQKLGESTVHILIRILYWNGIALCTFALLTILLGAGLRIIQKEYRKLVMLLVYLLFAAAGAAMSLFAGAILVLEKGNE